MDCSLARTFCPKPLKTMESLAKSGILGSALCRPIFCLVYSNIDNKLLDILEYRHYNKNTNIDIRE